jgi:hypothetical protein
MFSILQLYTKNVPTLCKYVFHVLEIVTKNPYIVVPIIKSDPKKQLMNSKPKKITTKQ